MFFRTLAAAAIAVILAGCSSGLQSAGQLNAAPDSTIASVAPSPDYLIGPLDQLEVFVWRAPELSTKVTVRPDGRISTPLVEDMVAAGKNETVEESSAPEPEKPTDLVKNQP